MEMSFFNEEDNHVQLSPELKVNQLLQLIDLEIIGKYIDLRAVDLDPGILIFCKYKGASYNSEGSCKRWLDYRENTKCYKRLILVKAVMTAY